MYPAPFRSTEKAELSHVLETRLSEAGEHSSSIAGGFLDWRQAQIRANIHDTPQEQYPINSFFKWEQQKNYVKPYFFKNPTYNAFNKEGIRSVLSLGLLVMIHEY